MYIIFIGTVFLVYVTFNIYVTLRVNKSYYFNEKRRSIHKWLIWVVPFIGPFLIKGHWSRKSDYQEVMTKDKRKGRSGSFYESGIGVDT